MSVHATHPDRPDVVDLRSDTVTQPTDEMRQAMHDANVGDSLFGEDPTVTELEESCAKRTGMDAGLFTPTGSMANLVAILAHTGGRAEVICDRRAHILHYESGSIGNLAGCTTWPIDAPRGVFRPAHVHEAIRPELFVYPKTGLVAIENTHNGWSGSMWTTAETEAVAKAAHGHAIPVHCDGARIFNSAIAQDTAVATLTASVDSLMFCFSKGLSAPAGSILVGDSAFIERARFYRKQLGGAMRQAGILAAAAQVALDTMAPRLAEDHAHARMLARVLGTSGYGIDPDACPTNIIVFDTEPAGWPDAEAFLEAAREDGILGLAVSRTEVRFVTHRHIDEGKVRHAAEILATLTPA